jgi:hypothetical protein
MDKTSNTTPPRTLKAVVPGEDEAHFVLIERYFSCKQAVLEKNKEDRGTK